MIDDPAESDANRIRPSAPQEPEYPDELSVGHRTTAVFPDRSMRFSLSSAKNPRDLPSGDQNADTAPSVPGSGVASGAASGRSHRRRPAASDAAKTIVVPSGDTAISTFSKNVKDRPGGGAMVNVTDCGGAGSRGRCQAPRAMNRATAAAATTHGAQRTAG